MRPTPIEIPVVIDSVGPRVFADRASWDGDRLRVPAYDVVDGADGLAWAWGTPTDELPATDWTNDETLDRQSVKDLSSPDGEIASKFSSRSVQCTMISVTPGFSSLMISVNIFFFSSKVFQL